MKHLSLSLILLFPITAFADFAPNREITLMYGSDFIELAVSVPPSNTCSHWGYHFRFDATTPGGKNMLSMLLTAKTTGKRVNVWYTPSSAPGADHTSGCSVSTAAVLTAVGLE